MARLQIHIPAYNEGEHIASTIEGILGQSFEEFTLIVHDNKSTDDTVDVCRGFSKRDRRVQLNLGSINTGAILQWRRMHCGYDAEYIGLRSANDSLDKDYYKNVIDILDNDPSVGLAYSHGFAYSGSIDNAVASPDAWRIDTRGMDHLNSACEVMRRYTAPFALWGVYRRAVFERCRTYQFTYGGDHVYVAEAALYGAVAPTSQPLDYRREVPPKHGDWRQAARLNAESQLEERSRQIAENCYFYGIKQNSPFTDMVWGHVEMFSLTSMADLEKNALISAAIDIFRERFGRFMEEEVVGLIASCDQRLGGLETLAACHAPNVFVWLSKLRRELDKVRLLRLRSAEELLPYDIRIAQLMGRFS